MILSHFAGVWTSSSPPIKLPPSTSAISPVDADGDGSMDLVFLSCSGVSSSGARCSVIILFSSLLPVCSSSSSADCRSACSVDALVDGVFKPPTLPLPGANIVTSNYAIKWLLPLAAAGGSGSAWSIAAPPAVCSGVAVVS
jgi:hypothetical protein